jgi:8-oxo-dGTP pyrophosphatase MutT (NUDIX family)
MLDTQIFAHLKRQIDEGHDLQDRRNFAGHVTSSFALLNPEKTKVLMIHHRGFDKWLFPGGHYEGAVAPRKSALRELTEETGFPEEHVAFLDHMDYLALDIDTHAIPARPEKDEAAHWHHDFLYLGIATAEVSLVHQEEEVLGAEWISLDDAANLPDERVKRAIAKIIKLVRE